MKNRFKTITILIIIGLILFSGIYIFINGRTAVYYVNPFFGNRDITVDSDKEFVDTDIHLTNIEVKIDDPSILKYTGYTEHRNQHAFTFAPLKTGSTYVSITYRVFDPLSGKSYASESDDMIEIFVHPLNIMTLHGPLGDVNGGQILILCFMAFLIYLIIVLLISIYKRDQKNLYSYKTAMYRGLIVLAVISLGILIVSLITTFKNLGFLTFNNFINDVKYIPEAFSLLSVIILVPFFIWASISNIVLIIKEGKNWRNLLCIIVSLLIAGGTLCIPLFFDNIFINLAASIKFLPMSFVYTFSDLLETFLLSILVYFICMLVGTSISAYNSARYKVKPNKDYIIILGCGIDKEGNPLPLLKGRIDRAIEFATWQRNMTNKDITFVPSGGKGDDEIVSEAQAMKNYLLEKGIPEDRILLEDRSTTTYENMLYSKELVKQDETNCDVAFSTTKYHVFRAGIFTRKIKLKASGVGSKTRWYFWPNAFIREFIGLLATNKKYHFAFLGVSFIICTIIGIILGFSGLY